MNLERGEQFRKLGTKSLWSVEETLGLEFQIGKQVTTKQPAMAT